MRVPNELLVLFVLGFLSGCLQGFNGEPVPPITPNVPPLSSPTLISSPHWKSFIRLEKVMGGFEKPVYLTHANDDSGRLFVVEQEGRVWIWKNGSRLPSPFLDLRGQVTTGGEQGLLSIAFPPDFESKGWIIVDYTDRDGHSIIARYRLQENDPNQLDPSSAEQILRVEQPYSNHNGGLAKFGPDGHLYIGFGDGGSGGDPHENGQSKKTLLGKILRIDVDGTQPYSIPSNNPFQGTDAKKEIWAYGLRNPWRFSFDHLTGDLYIADVGQNNWEEVNFQTASSSGGENYGWDAYEGSHRFEGGEAEGAVFPVAEYENKQQHCSITGGYVYRGTTVLTLWGKYVFGDYCSGTVWTLVRTPEGWSMEVLFETDHQISSFGEDESGEVYVVDHGGSLFKFVPQTS